MQEPIPSPDIQKPNLLRTSLPVIAGAIKRPLEPEEVHAIGFVVDASAASFTTASDVVSQGFGVTEGQTSQEAKRAVRAKIGEVTNKAMQTRIEEAVTRGNMEEVAKFQAIQQALAIGDMLVRQRDAKGEDFSLGGVPELLLPDWIKNYR